MPLVVAGAVYLFKKKSSSSATLGEDTLFPESRSPGTRGRDPLPRELQPKH